MLELLLCSYAAMTGCIASKKYKNIIFEILVGLKVRNWA